MCLGGIRKAMAQVELNFVRGVINNIIYRYISLYRYIVDALVRKDRPKRAYLF